MLRVVEKPGTREEGDERRDLDELVREGARQMLVKALEAEVASYIEVHEQERDAQGLALVVRNGKARARKVTLGAGTIEVRAPRPASGRAGRATAFTSEILPLLYLRGLSTGDFRPALEGLLGKDAAGLSAANIARLTAEWDDEYQLFRKSSLSHLVACVWTVPHVIIAVEVPKSPGATIGSRVILTMDHGASVRTLLGAPGPMA